MEDNNGQKVSEAFKILLDELCISLLEATQEFFCKFENTLKLKLWKGEVLGILFSSHLSVLNYWAEKFIESTDDKETKEKIKKLMDAIQNGASSQENVTIVDKIKKENV